ncbi:hypothetical protein F5I97DRAFT_730788 [Phlebopus sp. FC_14]|nr:hypothetical protein F5I97DRAFT_730788 [Phlebopus sp. FC_14]
MGLGRTLLVVGGFWAAAKLFSTFFDDNDDQDFAGSSQGPPSSFPVSSSTRQDSRPPCCLPQPTSSDRQPSHDASRNHETLLAPGVYRVYKSPEGDHATSASVQSNPAQPLSTQCHPTYSGVRGTNVNRKVAPLRDPVYCALSTSHLACGEDHGTEQTKKHETVPAYEYGQCCYFDSKQTVEPPPQAQATGVAKDQPVPQKVDRAQRIRTKLRQTKQRSVAPRGSLKRIHVNRTAVLSTVQPLSNFLPIQDRVGCEKARQEARRLRNLKDKYTAKKCKAESPGERYLVDQYESAIDAQTDAMEALNAATSKWIFEDNNRPGKVQAGSVDLHKLLVSEAIEYAKKAVKDAEIRGEKRVRLIVGQGKHSEGGVPMLRPAVAGALKAQAYNVEVDSQNAGTLIVQLE